MAWRDRARQFGGGQRVLLVDALQPNLLGTATERAVYSLLSRGVLGLVLGTTEGLYLFAQTSSGPVIWRSIIVGLLFTLAVASVDFLRLRPNQSNERSTMTEPLWWTGAIAALYWILFSALHVIIGVGPGRGCFGLIWALLFALRGRRQSLHTDVQPVSGLTWSWRRAMQGILLGLLVGFAVAAVARAAAVTGVELVPAFYAILGAAFAGITRTVGEHPIPGSGIQVTIRSAIRGGVLMAVVSGLFFWALVTVWVPIVWKLGLEEFGMIGGGPPVSLAFLFIGGLVIGLVAAVPIGLYFGILGALWYGGADAFQHVVLRWLLWRRNRIPWRLSRFLNHCTRLIFLQRVGSGYRFVHGMLMEYFANRDAIAA